jgi:hypothetical protein
VYGKAKEGTNNSEETLRKFYDWQCTKREEFASIRSETEASLQHLVAWFQSSQKVRRAPTSNVCQKKQRFMFVLILFLPCSKVDIMCF